MTTFSVPEAKLALPYEKIAEICRRHGVQELYVFGSVLRDDFKTASDIDFLVVFEPGADLGPWLRKFDDLENDLAQVLGRKVDVVEKQAIDQSPNYIRRKHILQSARRVYTAE